MVSILRLSSHAGYKSKSEVVFYYPALIFIYVSLLQSCIADRFDGDISSPSLAVAGDPYRNHLPQGVLVLISFAPRTPDLMLR